VWAQRVAAIDELATARALSMQPGLAWLDSRRDEARDGRYSFLTAWPEDEVLAIYGSTKPFDSLRHATSPSRVVNQEGPKPSEVPCWIGFIAYDACWSDPVRGAPRFARERRPVVSFRRYPALLAIDHLDAETWLIGDDEAACRAFAQKLERCGPPSVGVPSIGPIDADDGGQHREAIVRALDLIARGEVYEVNLARRWSAAFDGKPFALWEAMREASRVPLGAYIDSGDRVVLACTMERFLRWHAEGRTLVTRPIKGTISRLGDDPTAAARLRADPKERAEHSMVVDLMRNDLGRVAEVGSVRVDAPLSVEPFTGLYHLVSTVRCTTRPDMALPEILEATFPPGSVTGAPKVRAVEIIEELERHPRDVYCGAVGFMDRDGGLSLAVTIRTAVAHAGRVFYWAGGGIVEASDPDREVEETELKARVFLDAIGRLRS